MREIEIKAKVRDEASLLKALEAKGIKLSPPIKQHDQVFGPPGFDGGDNQHNWLRIRTENDKRHLLTLKRSVVGQLDNIEHETEIKDVTEMRAIIDELGFAPYSDLTKIRQKARFGDLEICFDKIDKLGTFIEAEKIMGRDADNATVIAELWAFLNELGIDKTDEETDGYDVMMEKLQKSTRR
jgi:adenylate cyclase class 2